MKTESHKLLGEYLIGTVRGFCEPKYEKAFLWGCIEPDFNFLTYLKGSGRIRLFRGHNFRNSEACVHHMIDTLQKNKDWGMREYYRFGKLIHYLSDAFTYPHNENFSGSIREHRKYEAELHNCFQRYIILKQCVPNEEKLRSVCEVVELLHRQYLEAEVGKTTDVRYIVLTAATVFRMLMPETANAGKQYFEVQYESSYHYGLLRADR